MFHCTTGKDRTGWAAAATLMLPGVSDDDVTKDFVLTNEQLTPYTKRSPTSDKFASLGGDPGLLDPVLGVGKEYLEAGIAEMRALVRRYRGVLHRRARAGPARDRGAAPHPDRTCRKLKRR